MSKEKTECSHLTSAPGLYISSQGRSNLHRLWSTLVLINHSQKHLLQRCVSAQSLLCAFFFYYSDNIMSNRCPTATSESENVGRQKKKAILKLSPPHPPKNIRTSSLLLELNVSDASQGFLVSETDHKTLYIQSCCESYGVTFKIFSNSSLYHVDLSKPLDLTFFYNSWPVKTFNNFSEPYPRSFSLCHIYALLLPSSQNPNSENPDFNFLLVN